MKLVWKWAALIAATVVFGACNNGSMEEDLKLAKAGMAAKLINQPDPEKVRFQNTLDQFESYMTAKIAEYELPGAAYAIVKDGKVAAIKTFGVRKKGKEEQIDENTIFRLASVSKGFAAVLAGVLVEKGYFDWNDKIKDHVPNFRLRKAANSEVTLRHTLSHTTGMKEYGGSSLIYKGLSYPSMIRNLRSVPIEEQPAKVFAYQNAMFSAIDEVARRTTDLSYYELLDSMLFHPLDMKNAAGGYKHLKNTENKGMPHVFYKNKGWRPVNIRTAWYNVGPAAGVNASISDMAIWLQTMLGHREDVVSKEVLHEIFKPHIPINDDSGYYESWAPGLANAYYGMGWRIFDYNEHRIVYHGGYLRGYRPEIALCPKEDVGIVFLTNSSKNELSSACVRAFFDLYFAPKAKS